MERIGEAIAAVDAVPEPGVLFAQRGHGNDP
jgi:hypothetical protein